MIHIGTSGYSFRDWVGPFYPPGTAAKEMLGLYARRFQAVEINATYYRLPRPEVTSRMAEVTPAEFRFTVKAPGAVTHELTEDPQLFAAFSALLEPLERAGKLAGVLAQFPYRFKADDESRTYLRRLGPALGGRPVFVEFRHASWARRSTFELLDELGFGFCAVDEPRLGGLFPPRGRPPGLGG